LGHELATPDILTNDLLLYEESIGKLFTKESELNIHACRSVLGFDKEKPEERIGNFLFQHTRAKITAFEKKSFPIRPIANPRDLSRSVSVQNLEFDPCREGEGN
jgi:hypothetical protein